MHTQLKWFINHAINVVHIYIAQLVLERESVIKSRWRVFIMCFAENGFYVRNATHEGKSGETPWAVVYPSVTKRELIK